MFDFGRPLQRDLIFDFAVRPFLGSGTKSQIVNVFSSQAQPLDVWTLGPGDDSRRVHLPVSAAQGALVQIRFAFTNPASPRSLGLSDDARELAVCLNRLQIAEAT